MTDNNSRLIEVEVTSDEADISIEESDGIATNEEERHTWIWSEQIRLVELVELHTKNWANILTILHSEHLCTKISNAKKLQTKFTPHPRFGSHLKRRSSQPQAKTLKQEINFPKRRLKH
jgi:hypothetical protein